MNFFAALVHNLKNMSSSWKNWRRFVAEFETFNQLVLNEERSDFRLEWKDRYPILNEKTAVTKFDAHYTYHPAWAARIIKQINPAVHIDISSTLHFSTIVSAFTPVEFYDYRPANLTLNNLSCKQSDLVHLHFEDNSIQSLSCMHVVEHIGLGRYGDTLDASGDLKAIGELKRVLAPGGNLIFVTPVGQPKICFNAHRIYSYEQINRYFSGLTTVQFALVDDKQQFIMDANPETANQQTYGCGCWWFSK